MTQNGIPSLHLLLTPLLDTDAKAINSLSAKITLKGKSFETGDLLASFCKNDNAIQILDAAGPLVGQLSSSPGHECRVQRDTRGEIVLGTQVRPIIEAHAPGQVLGSFELRADQGGLIGAGRGFLPQLVEDETNYAISVEWHLSSCPEGYRAVCSLGEGPEPVVTTGKANILCDCVFMVGAIHSYPPDRPSPLSTTSEATGFCGTYWFGALPDNLDGVKDYGTKIFPKMSDHFNDEKGSYRAFIRRGSKGLFGTNFRSSSIIDYDEDAKDEHDWDLVRLLNTRMIANWAQLDPEDDGTGNDWFTKGAALPCVAQFITANSNSGLERLFTVYLPFRFGQRTPDYFRATVNSFLSGYFTNPLVAKPLSEVRNQSGPDWYASSACASRSFVYMQKMDAYTRRASVARDAGVLRPIDDIIRAICDSRRKGEKVQKKDWLKHLAYWIGEHEAERHFREMLLDGKVNELGDMLKAFGGTYGPQPVEQEILCMGFGRESLDDGVVTGVIEGSRAQQAGLKDGDMIVWHSRPEACQIHFDKTFKLTIDRNGESLDIEYWPRTIEKTRCWQVLPRPALVQ